MTTSEPSAAVVPVRSAERDVSPTIPLVAAATLAACVATAGVWVGSRFHPMGAPAAAGLAASVSLLLGYKFGRRWGALPARIHRLMFRIADELAQYRAFTRLLRDQGKRITETTDDAAQVILSGLREMDAQVALVVASLEAEVPLPAHDSLQRMTQSISAPVVEMLGKLQFQDVTRQQIAFLAKLSLVVDEHMIELARQLGDRRSLDRVGEFKQMFNQALGDCVMTSQRDDHHVASGLDLKEAVGPKVELF
ncbi:MAG TPA: hypothetical protein VK558_10575 [Patescibacteria group bacterium]|nr:hypothetical protein [Patescibacteria group bacterium]